MNVTQRVGPQGQITIPESLLDELGINPGDEVTFWRHDDYLALRPVHERPPLIGRFKGLGLVEAFDEERRRDRSHEP